MRSLAAEERTPGETGQQKLQEENEGRGFFVAFREQNQDTGRTFAKSQPLIQFKQLSYNQRADKNNILPPEKVSSLSLEVFK